MRRDIPWTTLLIEGVAIVVSILLAFAIDVQVGIPRFWTGVGIVCTVIGSWFLFENLPGATLRPSWIALIAGIGGVMLAFIVGMPSMVRTRFATPTIGREWMIGKQGAAVGPVDPEGVVEVDSARWRARTNRATPIGAGEPVVVSSIDVCRCLAGSVWRRICRSNGGSEKCAFAELARAPTKFSVT